MLWVISSASKWRPCTRFLDVVDPFRSKCTTLPPYSHQYTPMCATHVYRRAPPFHLHPNRSAYAKTPLPAAARR